MKDILEKCTGFEWDKGNSLKNFTRHQVERGECEQIFFNEPLMRKVSNFKTATFIVHCN